MDNIICLCVGDTSGDGHCITDNIIILSNLNRDSIMNAYSNGTSLVGFDFSQSVCVNGEDDILELDDAERLMAQGIDIGMLEFEDEYYVFVDGCSSFVNIWLQIVKLGNPDFEHEIVQLPTADIGGYGLFFV